MTEGKKKPHSFSDFNADKKKAKAHKMDDLENVLLLRDYLRKLSQEDYRTSRVEKRTRKLKCSCLIILRDDNNLQMTVANYLINHS